MRLLPLNEFQRSLRMAYANPSHLHEVLSGPEMSKACETVYAKGAKALGEFHAEHQKAWKAVSLLVDKLGADYAYLDVAPLKKAVVTQMRDTAGDFQHAIRVLKSAKPRGKTAGVLSWLSSWHPGILAAKAALSAAKLIYQKLRKAKDPEAFAAIKDLREALKVLGDSKGKLGEGAGELYYELEGALVQAFMGLSGMDKGSAQWEVGESSLMEPIHQVYPLGQHTSYLWMGSPIVKALYALEVQAKSGPPT